MERLESNSFPSYIKADWQKSFIKEVGQESLHSMQFEVDGETFSPYYTAEDVRDIGGKLPKINVEIKLGEVFDLRNGRLPINGIKASLQHGYDSPVFLIDRTTQLAQLDEIHMDFIFPRFELQDSDAEPFITDLISKYKSSGWNVDFERKYGGSIIEGGKEKMVFRFDASGSVLDFISDFRLKLDELNDFDPSSIILQVKFTGQFIKDIVKSRAVKIFWFNYLASRDLPLNPYVCEMTWDMSGDYPNEVLFHTNNIIAASMAQADKIILQLNGEDEDRNRILRNSIHIALIESSLGDDIDPVAGSYFIEYVANTLAEKAFALIGN